MPNGSYSVSVIQDYFEYIIKMYETLTTVPPPPMHMHVYINRVNNRLVFNIKYGCVG